MESAPPIRTDAWALLPINLIPAAELFDDRGPLQADLDLTELADRLRRSGERRFSICPQGPPGTGKSAYARYLADRLGLEVMHRRASDLMSMWVGRTEQNIAGAFTEARDTEAFLNFDDDHSRSANATNVV